MLPSTHKLSASVGASHKKYQRKSLKMMKRATLGLLTMVIVLCSNVSRSQVTGSSQVVTRNDDVTHVRVAKHGELRIQHVSPVTAPEIDPTLATDGLLLLVGCVAILRGRPRATES
jgi:hypothetical protein